MYLSREIKASANSLRVPDGALYLSPEIIASDSSLKLPDGAFYLSPEIIASANSLKFPNNIVLIFILFLIVRLFGIAPFF